MAKCSRCGKSGFFLKLTDGLCSSCVPIVAREKEEAAAAAKRKEEAELSLAQQTYDTLCFEYEQFQNRWWDSSIRDIRYKHGKAIFKIAENPPVKLAELIEQNSRLLYKLYNHPVFGYLDAENPVSAIAEKIRKDMNQIEFIYKKSDAFEGELSTIPICPVRPDISHILTPNSISDLPEIKYSPVGRNFSFDKIPVFVVIDIETTGLRTADDKIIGLSAVLYEDRVPVSAFYTLVNPEKSIPVEATAINGITDEMVSGAPLLSHIAPAFLDFVSKYPVVGYNLPFDLKFLWANGIDLTQAKRKFYDVLPICKKAFRRDLDYFSLTHVCEHRAIYRHNTHHALSDCVATEKVFEAAVYMIVE